MSRLASVLIPQVSTNVGLSNPPGPNNASDIVVAVTAGTAQASPIVIGKNRIFVIVFRPSTLPTTTPTGLNITFGNSTTTTLIPTATNCYQIPDGQQTTFDMGPNLDTVNFIPVTSGTVYIKMLGVN
jgi:hypothetical protein